MGCCSSKANAKDAAGTAPKNTPDEGAVELQSTKSAQTAEAAQDQGSTSKQTSTVNPEEEEKKKTEAAAKKKAEEEEAAAKKKAEEEEAAAKKKAEEEAAAKKKAEEEEAARKKQEEEEETARKAEEEAKAKVLEQAEAVAEALRLEKEEAERKEAEKAAVEPELGLQVPGSHQDGDDVEDFPRLTEAIQAEKEEEKKREEAAAEEARAKIVAEAERVALELKQNAALGPDSAANEGEDDEVEDFPRMTVILAEENRTKVVTEAETVAKEMREKQELDDGGGVEELPRMTEELPQPSPDAVVPDTSTSSAAPTDEAGGAAVEEGTEDNAKILQEEEDFEKQILGMTQAELEAAHKELTESLLNEMKEEEKEELEQLAANAREEGEKEFQEWMRKYEKEMDGIDKEQSQSLLLEEKSEETLAAEEEKRRKAQEASGVLQSQVEKAQQRMFKRATTLDGSTSPRHTSGGAQSPRDYVKMVAERARSASKAVERQERRARKGQDAYDGDMAGKDAILGSLHKKKEKGSKKSKKKKSKKSARRALDISGAPTPAPPPGRSPKVEDRSLEQAIEEEKAKGSEEDNTGATQAPETEESITGELSTQEEEEKVDTSITTIMEERTSATQEEGAEIEAQKESPAKAEAEAEAGAEAKEEGDEVASEEGKAEKTQGHRKSSPSKSSIDGSARAKAWEDLAAESAPDAAALPGSLKARNKEEEERIKLEKERAAQQAQEEAKKAEEELRRRQKEAFDQQERERQLRKAEEEAKKKAEQKALEDELEKKKKELAEKHAKATEELKAAIKEGAGKDVNRLKEAVEAGRLLLLDNDTFKRAKKLLMLLGGMQEAVENRDLPKLRAAIFEAKRLDIESPQVEDAERQLVQLHLQSQVLKKLGAALDGKQYDQLESLIRKCNVAGVPDDDPTMKRAQKAVKDMQEQRKTAQWNEGQASARMSAFERRMMRQSKIAHLLAQNSTTGATGVKISTSVPTAEARESVIRPSSLQRKSSITMKEPQGQNIRMKRASFNTDGFYGLPTGSRKGSLSSSSGSKKESPGTSGSGTQLEVPE